MKKESNIYSLIEYKLKDLLKLINNKDIPAGYKRKLIARYNAAIIDYNSLVLANRAKFGNKGADMVKPDSFSFENDEGPKGA